MRRSLVVSTVLLTSLVSAQHWQFEQVDTGRMGAGIRMRSGPDGNLYLGYFSDSTGQVRVTRYDTAWHFEDPDIPPVYEQGFSFDVGPHGEVAAAYDTAPAATVYAWQEATGWLVECFPDSTEWPSLIFDTSGTPNLMYGRPLGYRLSYLKLAVRTDSGWTSETVHNGGPGRYNHFENPLMTVDASGHLHAFARNDWVVGPIGPGRFGWGQDLWLYLQSDSGWQCRRVDGGGFVSYPSMALALDADDSDAVCYSEVFEFDPPLFYLDSTVIDSGVGSAQLAIDALDRPHVAYSFTAFIYRFLDGHGWYVDTILPAGAGIEVGGIGFDSTGEPMVAYHVPGDGVWLAHGSGITGLFQGSPQSMPRVGRCATLCRGSLVLASDFGAPVLDLVLLDAAGRKVMDLHPGDNDIRHLSPGIYFVRSAEDRQQPALRKIIVSR